MYDAPAVISFIVSDVADADATEIGTTGSSFGIRITVGVAAITDSLATAILANGAADLATGSSSPSGSSSRAGSGAGFRAAGEAGGSTLATGSDAGTGFGSGLPAAADELLNVTVSSFRSGAALTEMSDSETRLKIILLTTMPDIKALSTLILDTAPLLTTIKGSTFRVSFGDIYDCPRLTWNFVKGIRHCNVSRNFD